MSKVKDYFKNKTAEQVFTLCLLVGCFALMLFCAIVRLCGGLWFSADLTKVPIPSEFWQNRIMDTLFVFEMTFIYKILCRTKWIWCLLISTLQCVIVWFLPVNNAPITIIFNSILLIIIPICFQRSWYTIIDSLFVFIVENLYGLLFLVGRIGDIENASFNFTYNVLGIIDYKLFIVSIYLFIKYFGGIKLWKNQKRLICQKDL